MIIAPNENLRQYLNDFLVALEKAINCQQIQSEADLEGVFCVTTDKQKQLAALFGNLPDEKSRHLLDILGFTEVDVDDHCAKLTVVGQISYTPDYVLKLGDKLLAIVDLKAPGQNLDHPRWMGQILSYCQHLNAPLGILFSGTEARVFVNTSMKGLTKHKKLFEAPPIASVSSHEKRHLVEVLLKLAKANLANNPIAVANDLASKRRRELRDRERQKSLRNQLSDVLNEPTPQIFAALASVEDAWTSPATKPSPMELSQAWMALNRTKRTTLTKRK